MVVQSAVVSRRESAARADDGVKVGWYDYTFACLLSLIVMFSIRAVGILMVFKLVDHSRRRCPQLSAIGKRHVLVGGDHCLDQCSGRHGHLYHQGFRHRLDHRLMLHRWFIISSIVRWFRKT